MTKTPATTLCLPRWSRCLLTGGALLAALGGVAPPALAQADKAGIEALEAYFDFIDSNSGTIAAEQIPAADWSRFYLLDVRDAGQFQRSHIPGAVNIEWRRVLAERASLPRDKTILAYCNTGSFSGQVAMALRVAGFENVRILHGGYGEWQARGGFDAQRRAAASLKPAQ